jgi:peptide subunit release factor 1 (eRF1)
MTTNGPVRASARTIKGLLPLAWSADLFLSAYLPIEPGQTTQRDLRQNLKARLDAVQRRLEEEDPDALKQFREDRTAVEDYVAGLRPDGLALAVLNSVSAGVFHAVWLPRPLHEVDIRYDRGAMLLPLLDLLDEYEPVALATVRRDNARLLVFEAGRIERDESLDAFVPQHSQAVGWNQMRYQRDSLHHSDQLLKDVAKTLDVWHREYPFRRLFLSGPTVALTMFKDNLSAPLQQIYSGDIVLDAHAADDVIREKVLEAAGEAERRQESDLVEEVIDRAAKNASAVVGLASTLGELTRQDVHILVMARDVEARGRKCDNCGVLLPPEDTTCTSCGARTREVDLHAALPGYALERGAQVEVVHGQAASRLAESQGVGALLRYAA